MDAMDYATELSRIRQEWDDRHLRWFKITEAGTYHFALYDEPEIVEIKDNRVMKVPAVYADDAQIYLIGFGENTDPLSPYVGLLAVGYYGNLTPGWEFDVVAEQQKNYLIKSIPQTRPYTERYLNEARQLSEAEFRQLLEQ